MVHKVWPVAILMSAHVTALCRSGFFQLRQLRPFVWFLTTEAAKTLVQAFISCRLDYCNSLLYGVTDNVMRRVQPLQNAAACLITGARRCDHITPVLRQLHWLPVRHRVEFKLTCLVRQALCGRWWYPSRLPLTTCAQCHVRTTASETELQSCQSATLERSPTWPVNTWHQLQTF